MKCPNLHHKTVGLLLLVNIFLSPTTALLPAQSAAGRISGTVFDPSRAILPGVEVVARNEETGITVPSTTNQAGQYSLYPLQPGLYEVTAALPGFKSSVTPHLKVDVSSSVPLDIRLEVGEQNEKVIVEASTEVVSADTSAVESVVTRRQIDELPLNGRNFTQLIFLGPGSLDTSVDPDAGFGGIALNGNRAYSQEFLLDGTPNNNLFRGNTATPLSIDVIQEFKVSSAVAPAEKGQAGAQIEIVTRGGTNRFHGSLFEYYRGTAWQARNPFNTLGQQPFRRNQFGGSFGGPVVIPRLYDGHNRTFFFFNYEGQRQTENVTRVSTLPLDAFWSGDFSALLAQGLQLRDPFTAGRPVIPGNRLDVYKGGTLINPVALKLRSFMGSPTFPDRLTNNTLRFPHEFENRDQWTARLDHHFAGRHSVSGRVTVDNEHSFGANLIGNDPRTGLTEPDNSRNVSLGWTATLSPTSINELRAGWSNYSDVVHYLPGSQATVESLGLKGFQQASDLVPFLPRITFAGRDSFTSIKYGRTDTFGEAALSLIDNVISLSESFTHSRSRHTIKAGFQFYRTYLNVLQQTNARGQISFNGANAARSTGYSFADFLLGLPSSTQEVPIKPKILLKRIELGSFIQDDWAISDRLMISLGLRHEVFFNPEEERNRLSMFDLATGAIVIATDKNGQLPKSQFLPSVVERLTDPAGQFRIPIVADTDAGYVRGRLIKTLWSNWAPRVGFGYRLDGSGATVLRGGYGIFYTRLPVQYLLQTIAVNPPFAGLFTYNQSISSGVASITLDNPYNPSRATANIAPQGIARDFRLASNQEWNLTVERSLGWDTTGTLGYVGNKGTHLFRTINANARYLDPVTRTVTNRYAGTYGTSTISVRLSDADSMYNAMTLEFRRRSKNGIGFQGNWTWAKGLDDASNAATQALDVEDLGRDRADSSFSRRHQIKMNAIYPVPVGSSRALLGDLRGWQEALLGGWQLTGIWKYTTGRFMTASFTGANALSSNRPDLIAGADPNLPRSQRSASRWFNVAAFAVPPEVDPATGLPRHGNAGRNILVGPGVNVLDLGLAKSFFPAEGTKVRFRLEAFNALNHPNWGNPVTRITDSNAGTINEIRSPMRQVQFAVRLDF